MLVGELFFLNPFGTDKAGCPVKLVINICLPPKVGEIIISKFLKRESTS